MTGPGEIEMKTPVVALGLDAADPVLLERYMDAGHLPVLASIRARGSYVRLTTFDYCRAEASNTTFLTGCSPAKHGYWSPFRFKTDYRVETTPYEFADYQPFYGLGPDYRVAVFDMPQSKLSDNVNGVQVLGWGAHSPRCPSHSNPPELFQEIVSKHGPHPTLRNDGVHSMGDRAALERLKQGLETGVARRASACVDLLTRERWDLFLTYFSEIHSGQHYLWHLSHPDHPLYEPFGTPGRDPLLELVQSVDRAIGKIQAAMSPDARLVVFSDHGMESNTTDVPSTVFLPELLYRLAYPGKYGLAKGQPGTTPPPVMRPSANRSWRSTLYGLKYDPNPITRVLRRRMNTVRFHYGIEKRLGMNSVPLCPDDCPIGTQPPMWYHPAWPGMKAFALPSFSEGYVRLNVRGREARGLVDPADYEAVCAEITAELHALTDARTGRPAVKRVVRTRVRPDGPAVDGERPSDADLIVVWEGVPIDVVDHPTAGRIGPVPFKRSGSHVHRGFLMAAGPGVPTGVKLPEAHALDIPPTILSLLGASIPAHFDGRPLAVTEGNTVAARRVG
jgi:predicted AlkP superfamily phosphohydrolase/phosphomutase